MQTVPLCEVSILTTALSLGPCKPEHVLSEIGHAKTQPNIQSVLKVFEAHGFQQKGLFWHPPL